MRPIHTQEDRPSCCCDFAINKIETQISFEMAESVCALKEMKKSMANCQMPKRIFFFLFFVWNILFDTERNAHGYLTRNRFGFCYSFWYRFAPTKSLSNAQTQNALFSWDEKRTHGLLFVVVFLSTTNGNGCHSSGCNMMMVQKKKKKKKENCYTRLCVSWR